MTNQVSRRTVAKGAAWSVPVVVAGAPAAQAAASDPEAKVGGKICSIDHGYSGTSASEGSYKIYLGFDSSSGTVPAGTTITYAFTMAKGASSNFDSSVPYLSYTKSGAYDMTISPTSGGGVSSFTVTLKFNVPTSTSNSCGPFLYWTESDRTLRGGTELSFAGSASGGGVTNSPGAVKWRVAKRYGTQSNPQKATHFISKAGAQTCYPSINYTYGSHSGRDWTTCGDGNAANDTSTVYDDGSWPCQNLILATESSGSVSKC